MMSLKIEWEMSSKTLTGDSEPIIQSGHQYGICVVDN